MVSVGSAVSVVFTLLIIAFGAMFQFQFFLKNSFLLVRTHELIEAAAASSSQRKFRRSSMPPPEGLSA